jgi:Transposase DDE domain
VNNKNTSPRLCSQFTSSESLSEIFSPDEILGLAKKSGFVKRIRKLIPDMFIRLCCFFNMKEAFPSLKRQGQFILENFGIKISEAGLDKRFTKAASEMMKAILVKVSMIRTQERLSEACSKYFSAINICDSTVQQLAPRCEEEFKGSGGGASSAGIKVQYGIEILTGNIWHLEIRNAKDPDMGYLIKDIQPRSLSLFDLGYTKTSFLAEIHEKKAFFLCRYRFRTVVYIENEGQLQRLDLIKFIRKMKPGEIRELQVYLGKKEKTPSRLILEKLPEDLANAKRRKLKNDPQNKRKTISKERLEFCVVNAFITNVPEDVLPATSAREIYSIRWQIEIGFKTWKSIFGLKDVTEMNPHRMACMFYGLLIKILVAIKVFWVYKILAWQECGIELSELKGMKILAGKMKAILTYLITNTPDAYQFWGKLRDILFLYAVKQKRRGKPLPFERLRHFRLS